MNVRYFAFAIYQKINVFWVPQLACTLEPWPPLIYICILSKCGLGPLSWPVLWSPDTSWPPFLMPLLLLLLRLMFFLYRVAQKSWHDTKWHQRKWPELIYLLVIWLEGYSRSSEMAQLDLTCSLMMYLFFDARINGSRNIKTFLLQTSFYRYYLMIYMFSLQFLYFYTVCFIVQWILWYLFLFLAICWRCSSVAICVSAESLRATHSSRCGCGYFDWIRYFSHVSSPSLSFFCLALDTMQLNTLLQTRGPRCFHAYLLPTSAKPQAWKLG